MYKHTQRCRSPEHPLPLSKNKSQYFKENISPNLCTPHNQSNLNLRNPSKNPHRKRSVTQTEAERDSSKIRTHLKNKQPTNTTYQYIDDDDFIKPEDVGLNNYLGKGLQKQLQNAMKRQIEKQRQEITTLS